MQLTLNRFTRNTCWMLACKSQCDQIDRLSLWSYITVEMIIMETDTENSCEVEMIVLLVQLCCCEFERAEGDSHMHALRTFNPDQTITIHHQHDSSRYSCGADVRKVFEWGDRESRSKFKRAELLSLYSPRGTPQAVTVVVRAEKYHK